MQIVCQNCSGAYAVEDRLIGSRGVRAQCPNCKHLQTVRRETTAGGAAAVPPATPPQARPSAAAPAPPVSTTRAPLPPVAARGLPPPNDPGANGRASNEESDPFAHLVIDPPGPRASSQNDPFERLSLEAPGAPASGSFRSDDDPFAGISFGAPAPGDAHDAALFGPSDAATGSGPEAASASPASSSVCRECGVSLDDPFDKALGVCDGCRSPQARPGAPEPAVEAGNEAAESFILRSDESSPLGGDESSSFELSVPRTAPPPPAPPRPRPAPRAPPSQRKAQPDEVPSSSRRTWIIGASTAIALLLVLGAAALVWKPRTAVTEPTLDSRAALAAPLATVLPRWRLAHPQVTGDPATSIEQGKQFLRTGRKVDALRAEEAFQIALLLDSDRTEALIGYVQAVALGRGEELDEAALADALALASLAIVQTDRAPEALVAKASLLLSRSDADGAVHARSLAEEVVRRTEGPGRALGLLVLGRSQLLTATALAIESFDAALAADPTLTSVLYYRALAHQLRGDYLRAIGDLEKRLSLDPNQDEAALALGRLHVETGEVARARELFTARLARAGDSTEARIALALLRSQVDGEKPLEAVKLLKTALKNRDELPPRERARYLSALAGAERASGNVEGARAAAQDALTVAPSDVAANLQLLLVSLRTSDAAGAEQAWPHLQGRLFDPPLEKVLHGRMRLLQGKPADALTLFRDAHQLAARRVDALIWAGIAAVRAKQVDLGYRLLYQALQLDPTQLAPAAVLSPLWVSPRELLTGAADQLGSPGGAQELELLLYEGLIRFHLGELSEADRRFARVLEIDVQNAGAALYRSLIALSRKDLRAAQKHAALAMRAGRQLANVHYALGAVHAARGERENAERAFREAITLQPSHAGAMVALAELELKRAPEDARTRLGKVIAVDPDRADAKRLLFMLRRARP